MSLTVTDMFCGAGGTSIGAAAAGFEIKLGLNHWRTAIETFGANHSTADTDCADISGTDPRRYPRTDILHASPECTNHSLAKGASRSNTDPSLFETDPERLRRLKAERSRATMWDVPRFAEHHRYDAIVVENVVEAHDWQLWPSWWMAMTASRSQGGLGYDGQVVSVNSAILNYHGVARVPQSRDRIYVVFTRSGVPRPDVAIRPYAWCAPCGQIVESVQSWRNGKRWGRYRSSYDYRCPACAQLVEPPMAPAAQAIDWTLDAPRIGDRNTPLAARTMQRIQRGIDKYGPYLTAIVPSGGTWTQDARPIDRALPTLTSRDAYGVMQAPFIAELRGGGSNERGVDEPLATIVASGYHHGLAVPPALLMRNNTARGDAAQMVTPVDEPMPTLTAAGHQSLLVGMVGGNRAHNTPRPAEDASMPTLTTAHGGGAYALVYPYRRSNDMKPTDQPLDSVTTIDPFALVVPLPRLADTRKLPTGTDRPLPTQTARQDLTTAAPRLEVSMDARDWGFRMLDPAELGRGMAFPDSYQVHGNKRDRTRQYGNAVTPPIAQVLDARLLAALTSA